MASIPRPGTVGSTAVYISGSILLIGGMQVTDLTSKNQFDTSKFIDTALCYDIKNNEWSQVKSFPFPVVFYATCAYEGLVYVAGGFISEEDSNAQQASNRLYAYDFTGGIWLTKNNMNEARSNAVIEAYDNKLFLMGGRSSLKMTPEAAVSSVEVFDIQQNQWTTLAKRLNVALFASASFIDGSDIFVVGGYNLKRGKRSDKITVFNMESMKATTMKPRLRQPGSFIVCAFLKNAMKAWPWKLLFLMISSI